MYVLQEASKPVRDGRCVRPLDQQTVRPLDYPTPRPSDRPTVRRPDHLTVRPLASITKILWDGLNDGMICWLLLMFPLRPMTSMRQWALGCRCLERPSCASCCAIQCDSLFLARRVCSELRATVRPPARSFFQWALAPWASLPMFQDLLCAHGQRFCMFLALASNSKYIGPIDHLSLGPRPMDQLDAQTNERVVARSDTTRRRLDEQKGLNQITQQVDAHEAISGQSATQDVAHGRHLLQQSHVGTTDSLGSI